MAQELPSRTDPNPASDDEAQAPPGRLNNGNPPGDLTKADRLTAMLAERVMGWSVGPDRFLMKDRRLIPRWRFQPTKCLEDAFRLLEEAAPQEYTMGSAEGGFSVSVRIADTIGEAVDISKPRAITHVVARALGVEVDPSQ